MRKPGTSVEDPGEPRAELPSSARCSGPLHLCLLLRATERATGLRPPATLFQQPLYTKTTQETQYLALLYTTSSGEICTWQQMARMLGARGLSTHPAPRTKKHRHHCPPPPISVPPRGGGDPQGRV